MQSKEKIEKFFNTFPKLSPAISAKFDFLKRKKPKNTDELFHDLHAEVFSCIDCLDCANCCKTISPGVSYNDVERLAKYLRKRPSETVETYFEMDSDGDYVFTQAPCPFLMPDNYCSVYESRPKACREYPHTDRRKMTQILDLTKRNVDVCPAVYEIMKEMKI